MMMKGVGMVMGEWLFGGCFEGWRGKKGLREGVRDTQYINDKN
jgi:hypothetical protein